MEYKFVIVSIIVSTIILGGVPSVQLNVAVAITSEYRNIDGSGNNLSDPTLGQAGMPLLRHTSQAYEDGLSVPRGVDPMTLVSFLPSARLVSNAVSDQLIDTEDPSGASDMLWLWGQFVDHDIDLTGGADPAEPFDIIVPMGDPDFDPGNTGTQTIGLSRSLYQDDLAGVRQQLNEITAFIDASNVYGSDSVRADALRTLDGTGKLKTSSGDLLPFNTGGLPNAGGTSSSLFLAGDVRANEQVSLTAMHTLFVREHNRIAEEIKTDLNNANPAITQAFNDSGLSEGNFIYEAARCVVGAQIQHITYNEFLPILLGSNTLSPYPGYVNTVNPQIDNEFSTAAYRVGHTMLSSFLQRINDDGTTNPLPLQNAFFNPSILQAEGIDNILRGMAQEHAQRVDTLIVDDVRNFLFGPPGAGGFDLASLNIQRGRDHGLPSYNDARTMLGLGAKATFLDVTGGDQNLANDLVSAYSSVNEIDLWVGGLAESRVNGGMVGETFSKLLSDQFERLRDGDRFFYLEQTKLDQLNIFAPNLQNTLLSDIILRNTEIDSIQQNVFLSSHHNTPVGGTVLSLDSIALLLAGTQMTASWLIPVIISAVGIGLVLVRRK